MRELLTTMQFKKDLRMAKKRGKDWAKLDRIIGKLVTREPVGARLRPHRMSGYWLLATSHPTRPAN